MQVNTDKLAKAAFYGIKNKNGPQWHPQWFRYERDMAKHRGKRYFSMEWGVQKVNSTQSLDSSSERAQKHKK